VGIIRDRHLDIGEVIDGDVADDRGLVQGILQFVLVLRNIPEDIEGGFVEEFNGIGTRFEFDCHRLLFFLIHGERGKSRESTDNPGIDQVRDTFGKEVIGPEDVSAMVGNGKTYLAEIVSFVDVVSDNFGARHLGFRFQGLLPVIERKVYEEIEENEKASKADRGIEKGNRDIRLGNIQVAKYDDNIGYDLEEKNNQGMKPMFLEQMVHAAS
jgi:hypothetical protein